MGPRTGNSGKRLKDSILSLNEILYDKKKNFRCEHTIDPKGRYMGKWYMPMGCTKFTYFYGKTKLKAACKNEKTGYVEESHIFLKNCLANRNRKLKKGGRNFQKSATSCRVKDGNFFECEETKNGRGKTKKSKIDLTKVLKNVNGSLTC